MSLQDMSYIGSTDLFETESRTILASIVMSLFYLFDILMIDPLL